MSDAANVDDEVETEADGEGTTLPDRQSAKAHHRAHLAAGTHPEIDVDANVWRDVRQGVDGGVYIDDGDRLIGFMERNQCPVCGRRGRMSLKSSFTFVYGAHSHETVDGDRRENEAIDRLEDDGERAIACLAGGTHYFVGVASASACEAYDEWNETERERSEFRSRARELREARALDEAFKGQYGKGHLLAAIYEELGCDSYDERDLIGRRNVTQSQLAAILARIQSLDRRPKRSYTEDDWLTLKEFGVVNGRVEWHIPEWVDFDGLRYSEHFKTTVFGDD